MTVIRCDPPHMLREAEKCPLIVKAYESTARFGDIHRYLTERGLDCASALGQLNAVATGYVRQENSVYLHNTDPEQPQPVS